MARLAAKEKLLFYPTPLNIIEMIVSNIDSNNEPGTILDPCCGIGEPLELLSRKLNLVPYGNELHPERFNQLSFENKTNGAREFLEVEGLFNVIFDNPPYDYSITGNRMEYEHIRLDLDLLIRGGLFIAVVPETIFDWNLCSLLTNNLYNINVRRFPKPEFNNFKQVVLFGIKRLSPSYYTYSESMSLQKMVQDGCEVLREGEFSYRFYTGDYIKSFNVKFPEINEVLEQIEAEGVQTTEAWNSLFSSELNSFDNFQPILPLSSGHTAFVIAAGMVNGTELEIDNQSHILKGSTAKEIQTIEELEEDSKTIREKERLVQIVSILNLENGTYVEKSSLNEDFTKFLIDYQNIFVDTIEQKYKPLFEPQRDMDKFDFSNFHAPGQIQGFSGELLPSQQVHAAALSKRLKTDKAVILVGEMGSGKTTIASALTMLINSQKVVIVCPAQVVDKWKREAETILQEFNVRVHIIGRKRKDDRAKPVLDTIEAMEEPGKSILVMSYETSKNNPKWEHRAELRLKIIKNITQVREKTNYYPYYNYVEKEVVQKIKVYCCPDCNEIIYGVTGPLTNLAEMGNKKRFCHNCGCALWQQVPFAYGGRVAIAHFLNKKYKGKFDLICDEVHRQKGGDTDVGYASADLIFSARKVIAMTGTLYGGKASSIFYLMYRLFPQFRQLYAYTDVQRFVEHYGLQETIRTSKKENRGIWSSRYGYSRENVRVKEIPGVSPGMVTMLLNNTSFIKLADMGLNLPEYTEERLPIPLDERIDLSDIDSVYKTAVELMHKGNPSLLSSWLYASLGWMDCPIDEVLEAKDKEGEIIKTFNIKGILEDKDQLLEEPLAKDKILVETIQSELAEGRGVGVYFAQVNKRDWMDRIQKLLASKGIYSEILRQNTCKAVERESWYKKFVKRCRKKGQEPVLLTNGNLVKEGLDLIELPTLIETGIEYRISDLRQRDRRSWRITQTRPVRVIFLYYENTYQEIALQLIAAKLKAAMMVDGELAYGLAEMDDSNLMDALMKAIEKPKEKMSWENLKLAKRKESVFVPVTIEEDEQDIMCRLW